MITLSKELIGNKTLIKKLTDNFKKNKLSNSIIFFGSKGLGKSTLAFNFINEIFKDFELNNQHNSQPNLIYNNTHPNLKYINKQYDEKTNKLKKNITINQIRNLESFFHQSSFNNLPKFIIIDSIDDLNINSSNALLKTLEEPKNNTYIILISHQLSNVLPTIRSRCIKFQINTPNINEFEQILNIQNDSIKYDNINFLYKISNGSPGLAIQINSDKTNYLINIIINILNEQKALSEDIIELSNSVKNFTDDEFKIFLIIIKYILINFIKINLGVDLSNNTFLDDNNFNFSKINLDNLTSMHILEYLNKNENDIYNYNLDKKLFCLNIFTFLQQNK